MSRKREHQREQSRALAQQLGVQAAAVPEELRAHPRVCSPTLDVTLVVTRSARGLLKPTGPFVLHLLLVVIDSAGVRVARQLCLDAAIARLPGQAALTPRGSTDHTRVRYTRPGWFRLLGVFTAGATAVQGDAIRAALAVPEAVRVDAGGVHARLLGDGVAASSVPLSVQLPAVADAVTEGGVLNAAVLATFAAAHRVDETLALPLADARGKLQATLTVRVRL